MISFFQLSFRLQRCDIYLNQQKNEPKKRLTCKNLCGRFEKNKNNTFNSHFNFIFNFRKLSKVENWKLKLSKYGHSAFRHLCWVPVMIGVGCASLSPLGSSDAQGAHVGNSFILPDILSCSFSSRGRCWGRWGRPPSIRHLRRWGWRAQESHWSYGAWASRQPPKGCRP